jgi:hypothetical protein
MEPGTCRHHPQQRPPAGGVLEPAHRRLRTQGIAARRGAAHRHLEGGVLAQGVTIVGVFVAGGNGEHAKAQHVGKRVVDARRIARIPETARQSVGDAEPALDRAQQENPRIRREPTAVEGGAHSLAGNGWQIEGKKAILAHGGCGAPLARVRSGCTTRIIHEINGLRYIRHSKIALVTNNPG